VGDITRVREWLDTDEEEPMPGWGWPHPPICVESAVTGELRAVILRKAGLADVGQSVQIIETAVEGGYSESTCETLCDIEVRVSGVPKPVFKEENALGGDSAMARFMNWAS
jgi:hypothetical protein